MGLNLHKLWFYYRHGYAYYLAMAMAGMNTMILVYFTAGDKVFFIRDVFPHFGIFVGFAALIMIPSLILIGFFHYKRAYKSEAQVLTEKNPYFFKLPPGHAAEVVFPLYLELLDVLECFNPDPRRKARLDEIRQKINKLLDGNSLLSD